MNPNTPDDLRACGWLVAVHTDSHRNGRFHTYWLLVRDSTAIKGEGATDAIALGIIRDRARHLGLYVDPDRNIMGSTYFAAQ